MRPARVKASQIIPPEVVNLLDRLVHVDGMCVDDTNDLLNICEKMTILIIQQERQTYIGDFLPKNWSNDLKI